MGIDGDVDCIISIFQGRAARGGLGDGWSDQITERTGVGGLFDTDTVTQFRLSGLLWPIAVG